MPKRKNETQSCKQEKKRKTKGSTMTTRHLLPVRTPVKIAGVDHFTYLIEPISENEVFILNVDTHKHLKCGPQRKVKSAGGSGPHSKWRVAGSAAAGCSFQNIGHQNKGATLYLGSTNGALVAQDHPELLTLEPSTEAEECAPPSFDHYKLDDAERKAFVEKGFLHLPGLVDKQAVDKALLNVNEALGKAWEGGEARKAYEVPGVHDLIFKSPVLGVLEEMLGKGMVKLHQGGQIALRFPNNRVPTEAAWHVDGSSSTHMTPFQVLVGIALSSQPTDDCGNLVVFPGKHVDAYEAVGRMRQKREATGSEKPGWLGHRPNLTHEDSEQLKLEPGDVVFAHQKMPHRVAHNSSPNIRYMCYFRIAHRDHDPNGPLGGLWAHFVGLEDMIGSGSSKDMPEAASG